MPDSLSGVTELARHASLFANHSARFAELIDAVMADRDIQAVRVSIRSMTPTRARVEFAGQSWILLHQFDGTDGSISVHVIDRLDEVTPQPEPVRVATLDMEGNVSFGAGPALRHRDDCGLVLAGLLGF
jgi:hypothetical protein